MEIKIKRNGREMETTCGKFLVKRGKCEMCDTETVVLGDSDEKICLDCIEIEFKRFGYVRMAVFCSDCDTTDIGTWEQLMKKGWWKDHNDVGHCPRH